MLQKETGEGIDGEKWTWVTHACNDTSSLYPVCEYPYYPANFSIEREEGNVKKTTLHMKCNISPYV